MGGRNGINSEPLIEIRRDLENVNGKGKGKINRRPCRGQSLQLDELAALNTAMPHQLKLISWWANKAAIWIKGADSLWGLKIQKHRGPCPCRNAAPMDNVVDAWLRQSVTLFVRFCYLILG